eukprot:scaffold46233_cov16-Tisochrysis_lutea.AAC.2
MLTSASSTPSRHTPFMASGSKRRASQLSTGRARDLHKDVATDKKSFRAQNNRDLVLTGQDVQAAKGMGLCANAFDQIKAQQEIKPKRHL